MVRASCIFMLFWMFVLGFFIPEGVGCPPVQQADVRVVELLKRQAPSLFKEATDSILSARFCHDSAMVAVIARPFLVIWDCKTGNELHKFDFRKEGGLWNVAFSHDGMFIYVYVSTGLFSGQISKWDLKTGEKVFSVSGHGGLMRCFPGDKEFACLFDGVVTIRDTRTGAILRKLQETRKFRGIMGDPFIAIEIRGDKKLRLRNLKTFKETAAYDLPEGAASLIQSGKMFQKLDRNAMSLTFWSVPKGEKVCTIRSTDRPIRVAFTPDDRIVAVGFVPPDYKMPGGRVSLYDPASGMELMTLDRPPGRPWALTFSPDGSLLAASSEQIIQVWRITWPKEKGKK